MCNIGNCLECEFGCGDEPGPFGLVGRADLRLAAELLHINYHTLRNEAKKPDFPISRKVAGIRTYVLSEIAKYMGVPLTTL